MAPRYIIVEKLNEVYLKLEADADLRRNLSDYFSFEVPGYRFTPQYRNRVWDGRIRLYSYATGQLYVGLYPYLEHWCSENKVEIVKKGEILANNNTIAAATDGLIESYDIRIPPRNYQIDAFKYALQYDRGLILSPTASGKSLISYMLCRYYLDKLNEKILIIVPTTSLVEQLYKDFKDYGFKSDENISRNYHGYDIEDDKRIVISTWQSLYNLPKTFFAQFGAVIGDEAHLFKAVSLTKIMTKLVDCKYRIGMTGTLDGSKTHKLVLEGLFGRVNQVVKTKELIDKKQLSNLKINCLVLGHTEFNKKKMYGCK